jgi:hypothetical protein
MAAKAGPLALYVLMTVGSIAGLICIFFSPLVGQVFSIQNCMTVAPLQNSLLWHEIELHAQQSLFGRLPHAQVVFLNNGKHFGGVVFSPPLFGDCSYGRGTASSLR